MIVSIYDGFQNINFVSNFFPKKIPNIVIYAISFMIGVYCYDLEISTSGTILPGAFITINLYIFSKYYLKKTNIYSFLTINLIFFFGGYIRTQQICSYYENKINLIAFRKLDMQAKVLDILIKSGEIEHFCLKLEVLYTSDTNNITQNNEFLRKEIVYLYTKKNFKIKIGDIIKLKNIEFKKTENKEFKKYLSKEEILNNLFISNPNLEIIKNNLNIYDKVTILKNNLIKKIKNKLNNGSFSYFSLIFLGNKNIDEDTFTKIKKDFNLWGLSHYIARAGLHLLMVIFILQIIMSFIPINITFKKILSIALIIIYSTLSWSSIGFFRSLIMFLIYNICNFLYLPIQSINIVAFSCLLILLHNPTHLFFLDFQLSFGITFALAVYSSVNSGY